MFAFVIKQVEIMCHVICSAMKTLSEYVSMQQQG